MSELDWDRYFYDICLATAKNSKCLSRQIGAIIVRDRSIVSTGYNGPPRGFPHCDRRYLYDDRFEEKVDNELLEEHLSDFGKLTICPRRLLGYESGQGLEYCPATHAEMNALLNAARYGIKVDGCIMFMSCGIPCAECLKGIINAGIKEVVCASMDHYDDMSKLFVSHGKVKVRLFGWLKDDDQG